MDTKLTTAEELTKLGVGDAVLVTRDGKTHALHVIRVSEPGSMGRALSAGPSVTVGYGPGRWNFELDLESIRSGRVTIERA